MWVMWANLLLARAGCGLCKVSLRLSLLVSLHNVGPWSLIFILKTINTTIQVTNLRAEAHRVWIFLWKKKLWEKRSWESRRKGKQHHLRSNVLENWEDWKIGNIEKELGDGSVQEIKVCLKPCFDPIMMQYWITYQKAKNWNRKFGVMNSPKL